MKYGRSDLVKQAGFYCALDEEPEISEDEKSDAGELADDLEKNGGTYIKLGQLLLTRADILPPAYLEALERLQDDVEPFPSSEVEETICREIGVRLSKILTTDPKEKISSKICKKTERELQLAIKIEKAILIVLCYVRRIKVRVPLDDFLNKHAKHLI